MPTLTHAVSRQLFNLLQIWQFFRTLIRSFWYTAYLGNGKISQHYCSKPSHVVLSCCLILNSLNVRIIRSSVSAMQFRAWLQPWATLSTISPLTASQLLLSKHQTSHTQEYIPSRSSVKPDTFLSVYAGAFSPCSFSSFLPSGLAPSASYLPCMVLRMMHHKKDTPAAKGTRK